LRERPAGKVSIFLVGRDRGEKKQGGMNGGEKKTREAPRRLLQNLMGSGGGSPEEVLQGGNIENLFGSCRSKFQDSGDEREGVQVHVWEAHDRPQ